MYVYMKMLRIRILVKTRLNQRIRNVLPMKFLHENERCQNFSYTRTISADLLIVDQYFSKKTLKLWGNNVVRVDLNNSMH